MSSVAAELRQTALHSVHLGLKARMVDFGGWDMPVEYSGILAEHHAVRQAAGLFDVSHMGEIEVRGPHALDLVQHACCNDASQLAVGQAQYSGLMTSQGTFIDDLLVHKVAADRYLLVVNAGNQEKDFDYLHAHNPMRAEIENTSAAYTQLAIQGPHALEILQKLTPTPLDPMKYYWFTHGPVLGVPALIARTGYTGEDGFEIYFDPAHSARLWNAALDAGQDAGILPCGLGARNTLRLEAAMPLYGHEIDETTTVWEANLGWIAKLAKRNFLGREALLAQQRQGPARRLAGFTMSEPGIARENYPVLREGRQVGRVTSGAPGPSTGKNIGMAYVPTAMAAIGENLEIQVRQRVLRAAIVPLPFYRRPTRGSQMRNQRT